MHRGLTHLTRKLKAVVEYKKTAAVAAIAVAAFIYHEEIADFVGGKLSGTSAGGDAFM